MKRFFIILLLFGTVFLLYHCRPERNYIQDSDAKLEFSLDTVYFDTVFTTIGTVTKSFRIYNPHSRFIKIENINLAGGSNSVFSLNVDGVPGTAFNAFEIAPKDSMYVFVQAKLGPNESPDILRIQDSIIFSVNGNLQDIDLVAWGQDVHIIRDSILTPNAVWTNDKPYLILDYMSVDSLEKLTIQEGVKIHLHRDAIIHIKGSLNIAGSIENPVEIMGDRLEKDYEELPGQWGFIFFQNGSRDNSIDHAKIHNGTIGLYVNSPVYDGNVVLKISNTEIDNMSYDGIIGMATSIEAFNTVLGDCGNSCLELLYEGSFKFTHCTFANNWNGNFSNRKTPAVFIKNYLLDTLGDPFPGDINEATFNNCIIYGNETNEILIDKSPNGLLNYRFENILARIDEDILDYKSDANFIEVINNERPIFIDTLDIKYQLDSLSPGIDKGKLDFAISYPYDKNGESRLGDNAPDLGAFERIKK